MSKRQAKKTQASKPTTAVATNNAGPATVANGTGQETQPKPKPFPFTPTHPAIKRQKAKEAQEAHLKALADAEAAQKAAEKKAEAAKKKAEAAEKKAEAAKKREEAKAAKLAAGKEKEEKQAESADEEVSDNSSGPTRARPKRGQGLLDDISPYQMGILPTRRSKAGKAAEPKDTEPEEAEAEAEAKTSASRRGKRKTPDSTEPDAQMPQPSPPKKPKAKETPEPTVTLSKSPPKQTKSPTKQTQSPTKQSQAATTTTVSTAVPSPRKSPNKSAPVATTTTTTTVSTAQSSSPRKSPSKSAAATTVATAAEESDDTAMDIDPELLASAPKDIELGDDEMLVPVKRLAKKTRKVRKASTTEKLDFSQLEYAEYKDHTKREYSRVVARTSEPNLIQALQQYIRRYRAMVDEVYGIEHKAPVAESAETELRQRTLETYEHLEDKYTQELEDWEEQKRLAQAQLAGDETDAIPKTPSRTPKSDRKGKAKISGPATDEDVEMQEEEKEFQQTLPEDPAIAPNFDVQVGILLNKVDAITHFRGQLELMNEGASRVVDAAHYALKEAQSLVQDPKSLIKNFG